MSWVTYAFGFVLFTTILALLMRSIARRTRHERAFAFLFNMATLLATIVAMTFVGFGSIRIDPVISALVIAAGIMHGLFHRYQFVARKHIEASAIEVIMAPSAIIGYTLAIFWLGENVTALKLVGFALVLSAGILTSYTHHSNLKISRYALLAFLIGAAASIGGTIDRAVAVNFSSALTYAAMLWTVQAIVCFLPGFKWEAIRQEIEVYHWYILLMAGLNAIVLYCAVVALQLAPVTQVSPVLSSNVVFISLAAILVLGERQHARRKVSAALLACLGLFLVTR